VTGPQCRGRRVEVEELDRVPSPRFALVCGGLCTPANVVLHPIALAGWFGLLPVTLGLFMAGTGMYAFRRELLRLSDWPRFEDLSQGLRRIRRRSTEAPPIS
jgi:hypothetical protein